MNDDFVFKENKILFNLFYIPFESYILLKKKIIEKLKPIMDTYGYKKWQYLSLSFPN